MPLRLKHRWSLSHNPLAGLTFGTWWRLLQENSWAIDPAYIHRAAFITASSALNSIARRREEHLFHDRVAQVRGAEDPLFILGHWRSGTTHLHNLLALDDDQFAYPNTYQVVNPHTFLCSEKVNRRLFRRLLPSHRPMDNMELSFDSPQEDEFALLLSTLLSPYLGTNFPRRQQFYERYLTFEGVPPAVLRRWKEAFLWFCKKLTFKYGRALVLKSPPHTARIRLLLELFPNARFVHIHRHPLQIFQSFRHFFDTATWYSYLQKPDRSAIDEQIIQRYHALYRVFFAEQQLIPPGRFHELSFDQLERNPVGEVGRLYERLGLTGFPRLEPKLRRYVASLLSYRKNTFTPLEPALQQRLHVQWRSAFDRWDYPRQDSANLST